MKRYCFSFGLVDGQVFSHMKTSTLVKYCLNVYRILANTYLTEEEHEASNLGYKGCRACSFQRVKK